MHPIQLPYSEKVHELGIAARLFLCARFTLATASKEAHPLTYENKMVTMDIVFAVVVDQAAPPLYMHVPSSTKRVETRRV